VRGHEIAAKQGRDSVRSGISASKGARTKRRWKRVPSSRSKHAASNHGYTCVMMLLKRKVSTEFHSRPASRVLRFYMPSKKPAFARCCLRCFALGSRLHKVLWMSQVLSPTSRHASLYGFRSIAGQSSKRFGKPSELLVLGLLRMAGLQDF